MNFVRKFHYNRKYFVTILLWVISLPEVKIQKIPLENFSLYGTVLTTLIGL